MPALRQVKESPGLLLDEESGTYYKLVDTLAHGQYDSVVVKNDAATSNIPFGQEYEFARDIADKQELDCNFRTPRKLTSGQIMWVNRIGLYFPKFVGGIEVDAEDIQTVVENSFFELTLGGKRKYASPSIQSPSGFGWYGGTTKTNESVLSLGLPSLGGVLPLAQPIYFNDKHDVSGTLSFHRRTWIAGVTPPFLAGSSVPRVADNNAIVVAKMILHGRLYTPSMV